MALKTVDVTFQNLDSSEISLTDVSHYYDSDPTKVVSSLRDDKKKPASFMADTTTANAQVCVCVFVCVLSFAFLAWLGLTRYILCHYLIVADYVPGMMPILSFSQVRA